MKSRHAIPILTVFGLSIGLALSAEKHPPNRAEASGSNTPQEAAVVLVELFTSQGCSSCPAADRVLARIVNEQPIAGVTVIGLSEHVDYWNRLGWKDPFSTPQFSARQSDYSRAFGTTQIYTPQMIVDGTEEFVGSEGRKLRRAISNARHRQKADVTVSVAPAGLADNDVLLNIRASGFHKDAQHPRVAVLLAITEDDLQVRVPRGENAGKSLKHQRVVRRLKVLDRIDTEVTQAFSTTTKVRLDPEWNRDHLRAIVFLQDRDSRRVLGAAEHRLNPSGMI